MTRAEEKAKESCYSRCHNGRNNSCNSCEFAEEPYRCLRLKEFIAGYEQAQQDYTKYAQLWVDSGEVNIKSFKQFLKDRGYE